MEERSDYVTNALRAWREKRRMGERYELPSGLVVQVRRVSLLDLAERGQIPAPLVGMVNKLLSPTSEALTVKNAPEFAEAINLVVKASVVDPPVADVPDDEHLGVTELPIGDRLALFNWANSSAERLRPFRGGTGEPAGA